MYKINYKKMEIIKKKGENSSLIKTRSPYLTFFFYLYYIYFPLYYIYTVLSPWNVVK